MATPDPMIAIQATTYPLQSTSAQVIFRQWRKLVMRTHLFPTGSRADGRSLNEFPDPFGPGETAEEEC
jgi:hypothetical protein